MRRALTAAVLVFAVSLSLLAQDTRQASVTLKAAQAAESIEGDLPKAIGLYERAVKEAGSDRALVTRILLQLAEAQAKAGRASDARATYERIVREFPDTGDAAAARARLPDLVDPGGIPLNGSPSERLQSLVPAPINLRSEVSWVVSPDGLRAVHASPQGVILHQLADGTSKVLVKGGLGGLAIFGPLVWSPDSQQIAFRHRTEARTAIRVVGLSGDDRLIAEALSGQVAIRRWTTRGEIIATSGPREVLYVDASGGEPRRLILPGSFEFGDASPDGTVLVLLGSNRLVRWDAATEGIVDLAGGFEVGLPRISTDGKLVAYLSKETGSWSIRVSPLAGVAVSQSLLVAQLPFGINPTASLQWTVDGRLAFHALRTTQPIYRLSLSSGVASGQMERLVDDGTNLLLSPDNQRIAYRSQGRVSVMNADGSGQRPIGVAGLPLAWASAHEIAVDRLDGAGPILVNVRTDVMRPAGHTLRLSEIDYDRAPTGQNAQFLGSKNELILKYSAGNRVRFAARSADGSERSLLMLPDGPIPADKSEDLSQRVAYWVMSPSGDRLAYVTGFRRTPQEMYQLHVRPVGGGEDRVVADVDGPGSPTWTADGRHLVFLARLPGKGGPEFRRVDLDTGETFPILEAKHVSGVFATDSRWSLSPCMLASDLTFLVCQAGVTSEHRLAWQGVTSETVMRLMKGRRP